MTNRYLLINLEHYISQLIISYLYIVIYVGLSSIKMQKSAVLNVILIQISDKTMYSLINKMNNR